MAEQEKLFLTELRLCGESNHWRVDARYTCAEKKQDDDDDSSGQQGNEEKKPPAMSQEVTLSILVPSGDRSVVDVQIDAMERAITLLQATVNAARAEQLKRTDSVRG